MLSCYAHHACVIDIAWFFLRNLFLVHCFSLWIMVLMFMLWEYLLVVRNLHTFTLCTFKISCSRLKILIVIHIYSSKDLCLHTNLISNKAFFKIFYHMHFAILQEVCKLFIGKTLLHFQLEYDGLRTNALMNFSFTSHYLNPLW